MAEEEVLEEDEEWQEEVDAIVIQAGVAEVALVEVVVAERVEEEGG